MWNFWFKFASWKSILALVMLCSFITAYLFFSRLFLARVDGVQSPFERMALEMENVTEDGGVKKKIVRNGTGAVVPEGATCRGMYQQSWCLV